MRDLFYWVKEKLQEQTNEVLTKLEIREKIFNDKDFERFVNEPDSSTNSSN